MKRRKLVSLCGTAGLASLAGCQAFGGALEEEPPTFEDVELSGPTDATVGESVSLSVSVTNAGGEPGDFVDSLAVEGATDADTAVHVEQVPPSESRTVEVGPFTLGYAGEHRFALVDAGASHVVSAGGPTRRAGEPFAIPDGPEVVVSETTPYASLFYDRQDSEPERSGRGVVSPDEGSTLVVLRVSVANRGQTPVRVGPSSFGVLAGELLASVGPEDASLDAISGLEGEPLGEESIAPGEARTGWLLAEVPRASVATGLEVTWNRPRPRSESPSGTTTESGSGDAAESEPGESDETTRPGSGEAPEVSWTFDPAESPRFVATDPTLLDATELGSSVTVTATVENSGPVAGTYHGVLERRYADETDWERLETFEKELSAGASTTLGTEIRADAVGRAEYRLRPGYDAGSGTASLTVRPAERALGETFTTSEGASIRAEIGTDDFEGLFDLYSYHDGTFNRVRSSRDYTFAFVRVTVENNAAEPLRFPGLSAFSVLRDGEEYEVYHTATGANVSMRSPVEGPFYAPKSTFEPGATYSGWLVFNVPEETTVADLTVRWSPTDNEVATWSRTGD